MTEIPGHPTFQRTMELEDAVEPDVQEALQSLHERDLITKAGERQTSMLFSEEDSGSTTVWELTDTGLQEAQTLNDHYTDELETLKQRYGGIEDIPPWTCHPAPPLRYHPVAPSDTADRASLWSEVILGRGRPRSPAQPRQ